MKLFRYLINYVKASRRIVDQNTRGIKKEKSPSDLSIRQFGDQHRVDRLV